MSHKSLSLVLTSRDTVETFRDSYHDFHGKGSWETEHEASVLLKLMSEEFKALKLFHERHF